MVIYQISVHEYQAILWLTLEKIRGKILCTQRYFAQRKSRLLVFEARGSMYRYQLCHRHNSFTEATQKFR